MREGMYGLSAFWVNPDQVKRSAPVDNFCQKVPLLLKDNEILSKQVISS